MMHFKAITLADRELINGYFSLKNYRNCDFSFANLFCWRGKYRFEYALVSGFLVIRFVCDDGNPCFMMPLGEGDLREVLQQMIANAREEGFQFRIYAITRAMDEQIESAMPDVFYYIEERDYFEYLYRRQDLVELAGKKYQPKRNHINRFISEHPDWEYSSITPALIPGCLELYHHWQENVLARHPEQELVDEELSLRETFENYEALDLRGGVLLAGGKIVAFAVGEGLCADTFVVHIEKALFEVEGAFAMINREFATHEAEGYEFINREEDLGLESLRKAKLSYHPVAFLERGSVCLKDDITPNSI
ncbi:MAG: phosphatidylglycerol lysyltransferase domain-containing protein [Prevotellaceae bacterium]|jgi:hypothetical protein|nr:phosphatidylglycerol lysyltransferase domain-containing protein [Prevotellaceae bacterium]